jgi:long-chain acyl-CoA synthetase
MDDLDVAHVADDVVLEQDALPPRRSRASAMTCPDAQLLLAWHQFADAAHAGAEQAGVECVLLEPGEFEALLRRCQPAPRSPRASPTTRP